MDDEENSHDFSNINRPKIPWPNSQNKDSIRKQQSECAEALKLRLHQKYNLPLNNSQKPETNYSRITTKSPSTQPPIHHMPPPLDLDFSKSFSSISSHHKISSFGKLPPPDVESLFGNKNKETSSKQQIAYSLLSQDLPKTTRAPCLNQDINHLISKTFYEHLPQNNFENTFSKQTYESPKNNHFSQTSIPQTFFIQQKEIQAPHLNFIESDTQGPLPLLPCDTEMIYPDGHSSPAKKN